MIVARTLKGKGVAVFEGQDGWHGKPLKRGAETAQAVAELEGQLVETTDSQPVVPRPRRRCSERPLPDFVRAMPDPAYAMGDLVATREGYGNALRSLGHVDERIVALDADVKNSTFSERFEQAFPDRFYQAFIAEQAMVGMAMGLASRGAIPFPSSFACFLERASDFIRMAGISNLNVKFAGSHAGVSIGEDGPSQMALEDLAITRAVPNCTVLYPCDGVSAERLVALAAATPGPVYIRTTRPKTPVLYAASEKFSVGGSTTLRESDRDVATVAAAGITVFEALKAHDELAKAGIAIRVLDVYSLQPIDRDGLVAAGRATSGRIVTVEDHYAAGGLGDAVSEGVWDQGFRVRRLAVRQIPRSGATEELLDHYGISARAIVGAVREMIG
jgi:transketolase